MIIFIPSASHPITPCCFNITVQNHHEPSTDGCSYVCVNNCALPFRLRVPIGCTTELNHSGHQFLQQLFDKYDDVSPPTLADFPFWFSYSEAAVCFPSQDKDGALSPTELANLFRVCPYTPWGDGVYVSVPTTAEGYISNHGYHCQWM